MGHSVYKENRYVGLSVSFARRPSKLLILWPSLTTLWPSLYRPDPATKTVSRSRLQKQETVRAVNLHYIYIHFASLSVLSLSLIPGQGNVSPPQSSPVSSSCVLGRKSRCSWWRCVLACDPDSTGVDAVLSRRRLYSVDTMETVVVQFGVGSWPEAESGPF